MGVAMSEKPERPRAKHGLSFLATLAFVGGFFGARIFHTLFPDVMVIEQGIHFHHFWYGLAMVLIAGWGGIAYNGERIDRVYAVLFGLGAGFIGDEVGLLLTLGNYYTELTFEFFVAAIAFILMVALFLRYKTQIVENVVRLGVPERMTHVGVFLIGFSAFFFAFGVVLVGIPLAAAGFVLALWGATRKALEEARPAA